MPALIDAARQSSLYSIKNAKKKTNSKPASTTGIVYFWQTKCKNCQKKLKKKYFKLSNQKCAFLKSNENKLAIIAQQALNFELNNIETDRQTENKIKLNKNPHFTNLQLIHLNVIIKVKT